MTGQSGGRSRLTLAAAAVALAAGLIGYGVAQFHTPAPSRAAGPTAAKPRALYYYDPMVPARHFDKPGLSPMGMKMIPKYADAGGRSQGVTVDPAARQSLGLRLASVERGTLASGLDVTGVIDFDERDVAIVQARSAAFVQRVYGRAPGDVVAAGAPIADLLVPAWSGAQTEYLAVKAAGDPALTAAARQRLALLGMSSALIAQLERSGRVRNVSTVTTPVGGAIQTLEVRAGMTVAAGQTLAQVTGFSKVWLNAALPEGAAGQVRLGQIARAELTAFPGRSFGGRVAAILPTAQADSRTLTVRVELPNPGGRLRPGMFAKVRLEGAASSALLVPSEAVIRTGRRDLVMLAGEGGRYRPVEVRTGREGGGRTEILAGLAAGDKVVASGQFLLDSEASLTGVESMPLTPAAAAR